MCTAFPARRGAFHTAGTGDISTAGHRMQYILKKHITKAAVLHQGFGLRRPGAMSRDFFYCPNWGGDAGEEG